MKITEKMVDYVSTLSRLKLQEEDRVQIASELERILEFMDVLNTLDTEGVEPMSHIFPIKNILRSDTVELSTDRGLLLQNAPIPDETAFLVPKTVE